MTVPLVPPGWPEGDPGRVLLNSIVGTSVDAVFEELFGTYSELQAMLHKQRNDSNCAESPWVSSRQELPGQQFIWPAPVAGADPGTPAAGRWRKVRFDAPPSLASKAFSSEEVQAITMHARGSHFLVDTEVSTTAMYGDQFTVLARYCLSAKGPTRTHLHVAYSLAFKPSLSRLMRPMVAKGVDGGIRGSFAVLKRLLADAHGVSDLPEATPPPTVPGRGAAAAAAGAAAAAAAAPALAVPVAAAAAGMPLAGPAAAASGGPLTALADYVVYQELVSGILQLSEPALIAKALAVCLTLALVNGLITALRPLAAACGAASSGGGAAGLCCWPLRVLEVPNSLGQVLGALLLVAVANKLLMLGVQAASAVMSAPPPSRVPSQRLASITAAITAPAGAAHSRAAALSSPAAASQAAGTSGQPTGSTGLLQQQQAGVNGRSSPVPIPGRGANGGSAGGGSGGGSGSNEGLAALSNLGNVVSGWGRNLLGAGVVDSLANNEGLKAFVAGSWNKGPAEGIRAASAASSRSNDGGQGPGTAPAAPATSSSSSSSANGTRARAMSHRHTNSFTAVMDPLGLNIIEDYAAQSEQEGGGGEGGAAAAAAAAAKQLPQVVEETASATGSPAAAEAGPLSAAVNASSSRIAKHTPSRSPSPSKGGGGDGSSSTSARRVRKGSKAQTAAGGVDGGADDASLREPLLATAGSSASSPSSSGGDGSAGEGQGPGRGAASGGGSSSSSRSATPVQAGAKQQPPPSGQSKRPGSKAVSAFVGAGSSHSASPLVGDRPAGGRSSAPSPLMRRSASPMLAYGGDQLAGGSSSSLGGGSPGAVMRLGLAGSSPQSPGYDALGGGWLPAVEPGQEEEDEVQVEVFEHERAQPFRGWGHTWPGHFLPSDKVGHWGDRSGAPGGAVSMLFDRVAQKLPRGWAWRNEWAVDMTGAGDECCDAEGWSYGMDFSWLMWPPAPQMGRLSMKSFVRRRRWVRTRARLQPGEEGGAQEGDEDSQQEPVFSLPAGAPGLGAATGQLAGSEGGLGSGLMGTLGLMAGGPDGASAAAAAASAMVNRFIQAVSDLPLSPMSSLGGAEFGGSGSLEAEAPGAAVASGGGGGADSASSSAPASFMPPAWRLAGGQQQQQAAAATSTTSRPASAAPGTASAAAAPDNDSDSGGDDSSSVDSIGAPPPRPRLSQALADLQQPSSHPPGATAAPDASAADAAAAGGAAPAPGAAAPGAAAPLPAPSTSSSTTEQVAAPSALVDSTAQAPQAAAEVASTPAAAPADAGAADAGADAAVQQGAAVSEQPHDAAAAGAAGSFDAAAAGGPAAAAPTPEPDAPSRQQQGGLSPVTAPGPEASEPAEDAAAAPAAQGQQQAAAPAAATPASVPAAGVQEVALGSGDWTWSTAPQPTPEAAPSATAAAGAQAAAGGAVAAAAAATAAAVTAAAATAVAPPPHALESAGSSELSPRLSSTAAASSASSAVTSPRSSRGGAGAGTPRSLSRAGSGARGSRGSTGSRPRLGAVPLRRENTLNASNSGSGTARRSGSGSAVAAATDAAASPRVSGDGGTNEQPAAAATGDELASQPNKQQGAAPGAASRPT